MQKKANETWTKLDLKTSSAKEIAKEMAKNAEMGGRVALMKNITKRTKENSNKFMTDLEELATIEISKNLPKIYIDALSQEVGEIRGDDITRNWKGLPGGPPNNYEFGEKINLYGDAKSVGLFLEYNMFGNEPNWNPDPDISFSGIANYIADKTIKAKLDVLLPENQNSDNLLSVLGELSDRAQELSQREIINWAYNDNDKRAIGEEITRSLQGGMEYKSSRSESTLKMGSVTKNYHEEPGEEQLLLQALMKIYEKMNTLLLMSYVYKEASSNNKERLLFTAADLFNELIFDSVINAIVKGTITIKAEQKMQPLSENSFKVHQDIHFDFSKIEENVTSLAQSILQTGVYSNYRNIYPTGRSRQEFFKKVATYAEALGTKNYGGV